MTDSDVKLTNLVSVKDVATTALSGCRGNACDVITMRTKNFPRQNILQSCEISNAGNRSVAVYIEWGNVLGGCGVLTDTTLAPGQSHTTEFTANQMIIGYCKMTAYYT